MNLCVSSKLVLLLLLYYDYFFQEIVYFLYSRSERYLWKTYKNISLLFCKLL